MTRIVCVSDLHEYLPDLPEADMVLIAGDLTFGFKGDLASQQRWIVNEFAEWCSTLSASHIVVVAGNHDQCIECWGWPLEMPIGVHYLQDQGIELDGLRIWGTPWQPWFYNWAFNAPQRHGEEFLAEKFSEIPADTDIVICHGPPRGYGDQSDNPDQPGVGSVALRDHLRVIQPRLMVCGHIHSGYGRYLMNGGRTEVVNAALLDNNYKPVNAPVVIDL